MADSTGCGDRYPAVCPTGDDAAGRPGLIGCRGGHRPDLRDAGRRGGGLTAGGLHVGGGVQAETVGYLRDHHSAGGVDLDPVTGVLSGQGCGHLGLAAVADADEQDCWVGAHEVMFSYSDTAVCEDGVEDMGRVGSWGKSFGPSHRMM